MESGAFVTVPAGQSRSDQLRCVQTEQAKSDPKLVVICT